MPIIPKLSNPVELRDFRPISLVSYAYKLFLKIIANNLRMVLPHIISIFQGALVQRRQILDGLLVENVSIDSNEWCNYQNRFGKGE